MGIKSSYLNFLFSCLPSDYEGMDLLELGDQWVKYYADPTLYEWMRNHKIGPPFPNNGKDLFTHLGFDHTSIDLTGGNGSLPYDLFHPIDLKFVIRNGITESVGNWRFDVVTDFGMAPHIWDQYQYFLNIFNFLKSDGIIIHIIPEYTKKIYSLYGYSVEVFYTMVSHGVYSIVKSPLVRSNVAEDCVSVALKKNSSVFFDREYFSNTVGKYIRKNPPKGTK